MWQRAKNIYHFVKAVVANIIFGFPAKSMTVIGVTGTDGKTTTAHLLYHILTAAGKKTALISTISATINGRNFDTGFHVSTPDAFHLQSYLNKAKDAGSEFLVLEVTSHGLDQNRVWGIPFSVGVLTNITHEHLDYHKTFTNYVKAKTRLLQKSQCVVLNRDDTSYKKVLAYIKGKNVVTYGFKQSATVNPLNFPFKTDLPGDYNRYNCLAAISACNTLGIEDHVIQQAIASFTLPRGRMQVVHESSYTVIVDFAHTPNSIEQVLKSIKKGLSGNGRIIHVFGAAGERDRSKRPQMGKTASKYADILVLTSEDPRSESSEKIIDDILKGIKNTAVIIEKIPDRQTAVTRGISLAKKDDVVIITGKGHEQSMNFGAGEEAWSDIDAVKKSLRKIRDDKK